MGFEIRRLRAAHRYTSTALKSACKAVHAAVSSNYLHATVWHNHLPLVQSLIRTHGVDINMPDTIPLSVRLVGEPPCGPVLWVLLAWCLARFFALELLWSLRFSVGGSLFSARS